MLFRSHSQANSYQVPLTPLASAGVARPLRPEGWTVRYEYKMACFAEFRGEDQVALKYVTFLQLEDVLLRLGVKTLPRRVLRAALDVRLNGHSTPAHEAMGGGEGTCGLYQCQGRLALVSP